MRRVLIVFSVLTACARSQPPPADAGVDGAVATVTLGVPSQLALPAVSAGTGASTASGTVTNPSTTPAVVTFTLTGDPRLHLTATPAFVPAEGQATFSIRFDGAATQLIARATLTIASDGSSVDVPVYAVAVDPAVPAASYVDVAASDGRPCGVGTTLSLPSAPFPDPSGTWTDASVRIFLPEGFRDVGRQDLVLHFHGANTTLATVLATQHLERHLCAAGADAILIVPQGPVASPSGNFGKLMTPAGTNALLDQVLTVLYRDGRIVAPVVGSVTLTAQSSGYQAAAINAASDLVDARAVCLYDALYGSAPVFEGFALTQRTFRSNYTATGGTLAANQALAASLDAQGIRVSETATLPALRDADSVIDLADTVPEKATRFQNAYGDRLRFALDHHRRGARIELRTATAVAGTATVEWLAPPDAERTGFVVEAATDGTTFTEVARVDSAATRASFGVFGTAAVRVRSLLSYEPSGGAQVSDTYAVTSDASVLVVDAFERVIGGSFSGAAHDFASRIGGMAGASTVSHRAITEDGFSLAPYRVVVWLAGDQSVDDLPVSPDEQGLLTAYVSAGGRLLVSGSEVAYALAGDTFLGLLGASFDADLANALSATGVGALSSLGTLAFGGTAAPYPEDYPDVLLPANGGVSLLQYGTGGAAAVGIAGKALLVGFPLEVVDDPTRLSTLVTALLAFLG